MWRSQRKPCSDFCQPCDLRHSSRKGDRPRGLDQTAGQRKAAMVDFEGNLRVGNAEVRRRDQHALGRAAAVAPAIERPRAQATPRPSPIRAGDERPQTPVCRPSLPPRPTSFKGSIWRLLDDSADSAKAVRPTIFLRQARRRSRAAKNPSMPESAGSGRTRSAGVVRRNPSGVTKSAVPGSSPTSDRIGGDRLVLGQEGPDHLLALQRIERAVGEDDPPAGPDQSHGTVQQAALQAGEFLDISRRFGPGHVGMAANRTGRRTRRVQQNGVEKAPPAAIRVYPPG